MGPENFQEELPAERSPVSTASRSHGKETASRSLKDRFSVARWTGAASGQKRNAVAFKFGGSSLLGAERMFHAAHLVRDAFQSSPAPGLPHSRITVVVSAMKGVTDHLLSIAHALAHGKLAQARREAELVLDLHLDVLDHLQIDERADCFAPVAAHDIHLRVRRELQLLGRDLLHEVPRDGQIDATPELFDRFASFGERFCARLFAAALEKLGVAAVPVASSDFVLTCDTFRDAQPHLEQTRQRGRKILLPLLAEGIVPVVTGFIGATPDGRITTLGRNSSDFSGAIVAHVVDADELIIWTDVDGIYTANPSQSAEACLLHQLSYDQARALAASGAKVLHAKVLPLAAETKMVVWVRNTFNPQARGTRIGPVPEYSASSAQGGAA